MAVKVDTPDLSDLLPNPRVAARYRVTSRTVDRWERQPGLNFPKPTRINHRKYYRIADLEIWERSRA